jgi:hypothetical protein
LISSATATEETAAAPSRRRDRSSPAEALLARFRTVRDFTSQLCAGLAPEDCVVQSMPDVSPAKWHLAHTTWFFETFILKKWIPAYQPEVPQYAYLFNSYYNAAGDMHRRPSWFDFAAHRRGNPSLSFLRRFAHRRSPFRRRRARLWRRSSHSSSSGFITSSSTRSYSSQILSTCSRKILSIRCSVSARSRSFPENLPQ